MYRLVVGIGAFGVAAAIALGARENLTRRQAPAAPAATQAAPVASVAKPAGAAAPVVAPLQAAAPPPPVAPAAAAAPAAGLPESTPRTQVRPAAEIDEGPAAAAATPQGEADAVLRRAAAAFRRVRTLKANFVQVMRNPVLGGTTTSRGTLFQRRPDRLLMRFSQPAGDLVVSDGTNFWVYYPSVDARQVIRMPASSAGGGLDLQAQFLGDPATRFNARLEGKERVAGRDATILRLTPRSPMSFRDLKVWVDARDALVRRFEINEQNGSVRRMDLSDLRVNVAIPESTFRFTPPAGARVVTR